MVLERRSLGGPLMEPPSNSYPVTFSVDQPARQLNRLSTFFRMLTVIPIAILISAITGFSTGSGQAGEHTQTLVLGGTGLLFLRSC